VTLGTPDFKESYARYRKQGSDEPTGTRTGGAWYEEDTPSPRARNDEIPEFSDIVYPVLATLITVAVVRRRHTAKAR
jgi:hypothetical protein